MSNQTKTLKKDVTLLESAIEHSKEIVGIKIAMRKLQEFIFLSARLRFRPIDISSASGMLREYRMKISEAEGHCANILRAEYSKDGLVIDDKFHFSAMEMSAGFVLVDKRGYRKTAKGKPESYRETYVLFLGKNEDAFLETIEPGEIHPLREVQDRLIYTQPAWKKNSVLELYLQKYKEVPD
jgi:hypothetical protein